MTLEFSKSAYSSTVLQKAAYEVAADLTIVIKEEGNNYVIAATSATKAEMEPDVSNFVRIANDYALREKLANQTAPLRDLILAHAYSKTQFVRQ
jgi:His-Xaa-Ser system protein HxsD